MTWKEKGNNAARGRLKTIVDGSFLSFSMRTHVNFPSTVLKKCVRNRCTRRWGRPMKFHNAFCMNITVWIIDSLPTYDTDCLISIVRAHDWRFVLIRKIIRNTFLYGTSCTVSNEHNLKTRIGQSVIKIYGEHSPQDKTNKNLIAKNQKTFIPSFSYNSSTNISLTIKFKTILYFQYITTLILLIHITQ